MDECLPEDLKEWLPGWEAENQFAATDKRR